MLRFDIHACLSGLVCVPLLGAATIESSGGFVWGAETSVGGTVQSQAAFGSGLQLAAFSSGDSSVTGVSGPLAAVSNVPSIGDDRFNFIASLGDVLDVTYDDVLFLSGLFEPDGESLSFEVTVNAGELAFNGVPTSPVRLQSGERFAWTLPSSGQISDFVMTIVGRDVVDLPSADSPLAVEALDEVVFSVKGSDGSPLSAGSQSDFGIIEVVTGSAEKSFAIANETVISPGPGALQRLNAETATWSPSDRRSGLVLWQQIPPRASRLIVSALDLSGPAAGDFEISGIMLPTVLDPGESEAFTVTFRPEEPGERLATVSVIQPGQPQGFFGFGLRGVGNRAPDPVPDTIVRSVGLEPIKIRVADLLFNDRDLDGDMVQFAGLAALQTDQGRTLEVLNDNWLVYYPGAPDEVVDDQFRYQVTDGRGTIATAVVTIQEQAQSGTSGAFEATLTVGPGSQVSIRVRGIPGRRYQAQYTDQLNPPNTVWTDLGAVVTASPQDGSFAVTDPQPPVVNRIYRIIEAPPQR